MTAADETAPQTAAGKAAQDDKAAAADRIRQQAEADQAAAAEAEAKRQQTAAARQARAERRAKPADPGPEPAGAAPCEGCRDAQEISFARLARLETQVQAIGKLVLTGVVAAVVIWVLNGRKPETAEALEGAAE